MPRGTRNTHAALWTSLGIIAATATLLAFIGCSNDDDKNPVNPGGGGTPTTSFSGMFAGGAGSGTLGITINSTSLARGIHGAAAAVVSASGTIRLIGGGSVTLTGSYDTVLDTLYLAGGGYIIRGTYDDTVDPPGFSGSWVGPGGSGGWGCVQGGTGAVKIFIGTFDALSGGYGALNMIVYADTAVTGIAQPVDDDAVFFDGTVSRQETSPGIKSVTLGASDGAGGLLVATGEWVLSTNVVTGTFETSQDGQPQDSGTWEAELQP